MKKMTLLVVVAIASGTLLYTQAETNASSAGVIKDKPEIRQSDEQIFLEHIDECLVTIEEAAQEISIEGVAMVAFIPGDATASWTSKMKVVGRIVSEKHNFLGIAYAKACEMAVTLKDSGTTDRKALNGELGWKGGAIVKVDAGYLVAAFSGGTSQQDVDVSRVGLDWLSAKY
ncbi:hypothetical protein ACFL6U_05040 [Planctomycetota bacterium]